MQHSVLFHEQRSVSSFGDCGANSLVAEFDEAQSVGDLRAPRTAPVQRPGGWMSKMARTFASMTKAEARPLPSADHGIHQLSKGWAKRIHLAVGGRISCRTGRVWITLDEGGEDIVLTAGESKSFDPGACVLVEALAASLVSLEAL